MAAKKEIEMIFSVKSTITNYVKTEIKSLKKNIDKATIAATNRVTKSAATAFKNVIRTKYNVPSKDLTAGRGRAVWLTKATPKRSAAAINAKKKGVALAKFKALPSGASSSQPGVKISKRKPVSVMVKKGKRVILRGGVFIATMKSGHKGIFIKKGSGPLPIKEKFGPSAYDLIRSRPSMRAIKDTVNKKYQKEFEGRLKYYQNK